MENRDPLDPKEPHAPEEPEKVPPPREVPRKHPHPVDPVTPAPGGRALTHRA